MKLLSVFIFAALFASLAMAQITLPSIIKFVNAPVVNFTFWSPDEGYSSTAGSFSYMPGKNPQNAVMQWVYEDESGSSKSWTIVNGDNSDDIQYIPGEGGGDVCINFTETVACGDWVQGTVSPTGLGNWTRSCANEDGTKSFFSVWTQGKMLKYFQSIGFGQSTMLLTINKQLSTPPSASDLTPCTPIPNPPEPGPGLQPAQMK